MKKENCNKMGRYEVSGKVGEVNFYAKHTDVLTKKINEWYKENKGAKVLSKICKMDTDVNGNVHFWVNMSYEVIKNE